MATGFHIRPFQESDFAAVCDLDVLCFPAGIAYEPEEIAYFLGQRGTVSFVATSYDRVVAWILGHARRARAGHIVTIDVHPDFRRRGIGDALMDNLEGEFTRLECNRAWLEVAISNLGAQQFYQRRSYTTVRTLRNYYADGSDAFLMERSLTSASGKAI